MPCRPSTAFVYASAAATLFLFAGPGAQAQKVIPEPVTDTSAQASPLAPVAKAPVSDGSAQASPVIVTGISVNTPTGPRVVSPFVPPGTPIPVTLDEAIDSGHLSNGQMLSGTLSAPVKVINRSDLPAGSPVSLTVVETVKAGVIAAQGEFSLQAVRLGSIPVYTDTLIYQGKAGHQDLPDSAPALGTDAGMPKGTSLTFHIQPQPTAAQAAPAQRQGGPGSVDGVAVGGPPPPGPVKSTYGSGTTSGSGNTPGQQQKSVSPGDTTTDQGPQNAGKVSNAPNQPQKPAQSTPTSPTTPR